LYLMAEVTGPGAIVRGWSAGMGGILKVYLDPPANNAAAEGTLVWEGPAYDFLARRSGHYLKQAGLAFEARDAFTQNDADYFPIPFSRGLKVTWEGKLNELHFYHLQVRLYPPGTPLRSFDPGKDLKEAEPQLRKTIAALTEPPAGKTDALNLEGTAEPGQAWAWSPQAKGPGARLPVAHCIRRFTARAGRGARGRFFCFRPGREPFCEPAVPGRAGRNVDMPIRNALREDGAPGVG
jgi:hypothetical protein